MLTARILRYLEEIERRRLHLERHPSLFQFCVSELGYSENEANSRISAMRLSREVPAVVSAVESGKLSLTNLVKAQAYFRQEKKAGTPVSTQDKALLLESLSGKSTRECERVLAERLPVSPSIDRERAVTGSRTEITFTADADLKARLDRIRELWGHQGKLSYAELIERMAELVLKRIDPERKQKPTEPKRSPGARNAEPDARNAEPPLPSPPPDLLTPDSRHIPESLRREVWLRDGGRCTHRVSTSPEERCPSRFALELDHVIPYAYGGTHTAENLRLLCRAHHRSRHLHAQGHDNSPPDHPKHWSDAERHVDPLWAG
jgi:hypothetical protein